MYPRRWSVFCGPLVAVGPGHDLSRASSPAPRRLLSLGSPWAGPSCWGRWGSPCPLGSVLLCCSPQPSVGAAQWGLRCHSPLRPQSQQPGPLARA